MWCRPWSVAVAILLVAAACRSERQGQLVVVVHSDMQVPEELDAFRIRVTSQEEDPVLDRVFHLDTGEVTLPADFGVVPRGGDVRRRVTIAVDALLEEEALFTTRAITTFVPRRWLRLDIFLAELCVELARQCDPTETCRLEGCVPPEIDPGNLRDFDPGDRLGIDAGSMDAGREPDASLDASPDASPDASLDATADAGATCEGGSVTETCDSSGLDEDCDGLADERDPSASDACGGGESCTRVGGEAVCYQRVGSHCYTSPCPGGYACIHTDDPLVDWTGLDLCDLCPPELVAAGDPPCHCHICYRPP